MQNNLEKHQDGRAGLDPLPEKVHTQFITVMMAAVNKLAPRAESEGVMRSLSQGDFLLQAIKKNNGIFTGSSDAGCSSYFENALDAVRAAVQIQKDMDTLNMSNEFKFPILMRIGLHSGECQIKGQSQGLNIYAVVVDMASQFVSVTDGGGILMSEDTYRGLSAQSEIYCRFVKQVTFKGKQESCNAYQAFWNPQEIEQEIEQVIEQKIDLDSQARTALPLQGAVVPTHTSGLKLVGAALLLIGLVLALTLGSKFFGFAQSDESTRSLKDSVSLPQTQPTIAQRS